MKFKKKVGFIPFRAMSHQPTQVPEESLRMRLTRLELALEDTLGDLSRAKSNLHTLNDLKDWICEETWLGEVTSAQETINSLQDKLSELRRGLVDQGVVKSLDF